MLVKHSFRGEREKAASKDLEREMEFDFCGGFVAVLGAVGGSEEFIEGLAVVGVHGDASAGGEPGIFVVVAKAIANALGDVKRGFGAGFGKNEDKFISAVTGGDVNFSGMETENVGKAAERAAADEMSVFIVDFLEMIHIEQDHRERVSRAIITFDFGFEGFDEAAVVGEPGERVAVRQAAGLFFGAAMFGGFGGEHHTGDAGDGHEGLQKEERRILRVPGERTISADSAPGGDDGQDTNSGDGLSAAEAKRRPDEERKAEIFERIIFYDRVKAIAENKPGSGKESEKQKNKFEDLLAGPLEAVIFDPEQ